MDNIRQIVHKKTNLGKKNKKEVEICIICLSYIKMIQILWSKRHISVRKFPVTRVEEAHKYVYITTPGHEFLLNVSHKQVVEPWNPHDWTATLCNQSHPFKNRAYSPNLKILMAINNY